MRRVLGTVTFYVIARVAESLLSRAGPSPSPRRVKASDLSPEKKFEIATAAAEQIWREQQITSYRMTWTLTFEGFLFAAFNFSFAVAPGLPDLIRLGVQIVVAFGGLRVSQAARHSILASQNQRQHMKDIWNEIYDYTAGLDGYPRPFSANSETNKGRQAAATILNVIWWMWLALGILAFAFWITADRKNIATFLATHSFTAFLKAE